METKKPTKTTIQKEEKIIGLSSRKTMKKSSSQPQPNTYQVYSPYNCPGYPTCKECTNILC